MFIPDERFQAISGEADTWTLQVKYVQARDEGEYECQISTDPKKSHIIKLNIVGEKKIERQFKYRDYRVSFVSSIREYLKKKKKMDEKTTSNNRNAYCSAKDRDLGGP